MSNDQNKAGINPISNKQLGTAPAPLIMPSARRPSAVVAGKSVKSRKEGQQQDKEPLAGTGEQPLYDMAVVPEEGAAERTREGAEAAMSVRRGKDEDEDASLDKSAAASGEDAPMLLAQAGSSDAATSGAGGSAQNAPVSVGEELLRQAAPLPGTPQKAGPNWLENLLGKDWKLPLAIGGGALALLGLAARNGGGGSNPAAAGAADGSDAASAPAVPSTTWTLTVTPAAGKFDSGATVRASAQKWVGGSWQELAATATVDRFGRMSIKVDKSQVSAQDMLRVVLSDTGSSPDHLDEVAGKITLGNTPMIALIGGLSSDQQVTVNPLTTLAATRIGQDFSAANLEAVHAAVAKAFGISAGDLVHVLPTFLAGGGNPAITADSQNYGLALGGLAGMAQAQRDAGAAPDDALGLSLKLLAEAFEQQDGKLVLNLEKIRSSTVSTSTGDKAVGVDEGAARLFKAAAIAGTGAEGGQIPYIAVDGKAEPGAADQKTAAGVDAIVSAASFADGLTLKVNTAASVKAGDNVRIEFIKLKSDGSVDKNASIFTYDYVLTQKDVDRVGSNAGDLTNKGGSYFTLIVPTHDDDPAKIGPENGARPALASSNGNGAFLLPVDLNKENGQSYYQVNSPDDTQFQLRASGSALGFASAGARISVSNQQTLLEAAPGSGFFNGGDVPAANTIRVAVTLPNKISWSGGNPTLDLMIAGQKFKATLETGINSDVLHFVLKLSSKAPLPGSGSQDTSGLEGDIRIPEDALHFSPNTVITTDAGTTLFSSDASGAWSARGKPLSVSITQALGVKTKLDLSAFNVDTRAPGDPALSLEEAPAFDSAGFRPQDTVPVTGKLNALRSDDPQFVNSVVTNKINQKFRIEVPTGFNPADKGATVKLWIELAGANMANTVIATAQLDDRGVAHFDDANYLSEVVDRVNRRASAANLADGVAVSFSAQVVDKAGNESARKPLMFSTGAGGKASFTLDMVAPVAPATVELASGSDTGRAGTGNTATRSDGITSLRNPELQVTGGAIGSVVEVWNDARSKRLGKAVVVTLNDTLTSTNGAKVKLDPDALNPGDQTLYVTITDQAGNIGPAKPLNVTYLKPFGRDDSATRELKITSPAPASGIYREGETIDVKVKFDRPVFLKDGKSPSSVYVDLIPGKPDGSGPADGDSDRARATLVDGIGTDTLTFRYTVVKNIEKTNNGVFKASELITQDGLEDIAGSLISTVGAHGVAGQQVTIDTQAPAAPVIVLPPDVVAVAAPDANTFGRQTATGEGLSVTAESGSKLGLVFKKAGVEVLNKMVAASGVAQNVTFTDDDLNKLGQGEVSVIATATDVAGNVGPASAALVFKIDTKAPQPISTGPAIEIATNKILTGPTNKPFYFTIKFDEALKTAPVKTDFEASNGSVTDVQPVDGAANTYRVSVTPTPDLAAGNIELKLKSSGTAAPLSDRAGNLVETGKTLATQAIDTQGPQVTAVPEVNTPVKAGVPVVFVVNLNEPIGPTYGVLGPANFNATNGTVTAVTPVAGSGGLQYKVTVMPGGAISVDTSVVLNLIVNGDALVRDALDNRANDKPGLAQQLIDVTAPRVSDLTLSGTVATGNPNKPGYVRAGDTVTVNALFTEAIKVSGTPTMDIDVGGKLRTAVFNKLSADGKEASFNYTIVAGDNANAGIVLPGNDIRLAGGSIIDLAGNAATLTAPAKAADPHFKVDTQVPTVTAVKIDSASVAAATGGLYKAGAELTALVQFSEDIEVDISAGSPKLTLNVGGVAREATYQSQDADKKTLRFTYQLASGDNDASGVIIPAGALNLNRAVITDVSGNLANISNAATGPNAAFKVDTSAPTVSSVLITAAPASPGTTGYYRVGDRIIGTVTFNENISLDLSSASGQPTLALQVGTHVRQATYTAVSSGSTNALNFSYTLIADDLASGGVAVVANSIDLKGASLSDVAGNAADVRFAAVPPNTGVKVDNIAPAIDSFSAVATAGKTLIIDNTLTLKAKATEALRADGTVTVTLSNGGTATLTVDGRDPTQLTGTYTVQAGQNTGNLNVVSFTSTAKDLAGNALGTTVPGGPGKNLDAGAKIVVDADRPDKPSLFQFDATSDAGTPGDGLTNVTLPGFHLEGLVPGVRVLVTASYKGSTLTLLDFIASAASQTVTMSGAALLDGDYTNVVARQISANGNASEQISLGKTRTSGSFTIDTVAPGVVSNLVFDSLQDTLTDIQYENYLTQPENGKTQGTLSRDYRTTIQQPRFDFGEGKPGEVAVLFRDINGNNRFDAGDVLLGRKTIGDDTVIQYQLGAPSSPTKSGHYVEVEAQNALANANYTDIKVVLQSAAGTYGVASAAAKDGLSVVNLTPLSALTGARALEPAPVAATAAPTLGLRVTGGRAGATVKLIADLINADGGLVTAGVTVAQGLLRSDDTVQFDTTALNGRYGNFKAIQSYAGKSSDALAVLPQSGSDALVMNWDHTAPGVTVALKSGVTARLGQPVEVVFSFTEEVKDFTLDDVSVTGGTLSALTGSGLTRTAILTPLAADTPSARLTVNAASYKDLADNLGAASTALNIAFNRPGTLQLNGMSGSAPQTGETLHATVRDSDGDPTGAVTYKWLVAGAEVPGVTTANFQVREADKGKTIKVEADYTDGAGQREHAVSAETAAVTGPNSPPRVIIKVNGKVVPNVDFASSPSTEQSYVLHWNDAVVVQVLDDDGFASGSDRSLWTTTSSLPLPAISNYRTFNVPDSLAADSSIHFVADYIDDNGKSESFTSRTFKIRPDQRPGQVTIAGLGAHTGTADDPVSVGATVDADVTDFNGYSDTANILYTWTVNGETRSSGLGERGYTVRDTDYGKEIKVSVSYTDNDGFAEKDIDSKSVFVASRPGNIPATGDILISGTGTETVGTVGTVGTVLTADGSRITDANGITPPRKFDYVWSSVAADGTKTDISPDHLSGNDSSKLIVSSDLLGKNITVRANFTDDGGFAEHVESKNVVTPKLPPIFSGSTSAPLSFAGVAGQDSAYKMILVDRERSLYVLDVNGDGRITADDTTNYITNLDANGSVAVPTTNGHVRAKLLGKDDARWGLLDFTKGPWGEATGAKGVVGTGSDPDIKARDFWTATVGETSASHYVWTNTATGPYSKADASFAGDPNRAHYNLFELKFNAGVLPA